MKIYNEIKVVSIVGLSVLMPFLTKGRYTQAQEVKKDTFEIKKDSLSAYEKADSLIIKSAPGGITDSIFLKKAPTPKITVKGHAVSARIVVDITNNYMYQYDKNGKVEIAYPVSTGRGDLTVPGLYSISHVEYYPYNTAPEMSLRKNVPCIFGDAAIVLNKVNEKTGVKKATGIMIHGRYNNDTIGVHSSGGCVRLYNEDIAKCANNAKNMCGAYVLILKK